jgi:hypothetical protein
VAGDVTPSAFREIGMDRRRMSHPEKHTTPAPKSRPLEGAPAGELFAHEMNRIFLVFANVFDEFRIRQQLKM